ncbi:D-Ala-D-Ala carboxypeptidase family metallohydrolase [Alkalibacter mobilis]|uniref:D-Ala-D-Ala carboxypeptidase family metallohydrolase n=1 Tax=Alkalibacter mobilis TaxID=2787712 RepID=UPI0018A0814E|nr:D-Ala-D-Ala carboxypeptidase family metallohydrolase [Alkalibacter mobilis]MBF7097499.1 DUF882 domain-containing protein [Alkalibacter mobilis]
MKEVVGDLDNREMQMLINEWLGESDVGIQKLEIDGKIGPLSRGAFIEFQRDKKLKVDGMCGPETQYELMFYKYKNFRKEEFKCKCNGLGCDGYPVKVDESLIALLQSIRKYFGKPLNISSGIRCPIHNNKVGGTKNSYHMKGRAADFKVSGVSPDLVYAKSSELNGTGGVIRYKTFTHLDTRKGKLRLDYR